MCFYISVRVDALKPCQLRFLASFLISVSRQGEVLLYDEGGRRIIVYKYQATTGTFTEMKRLNYPRDISSCSALYIYDSQDGTVVLQQANSSPTLVISPEGEQLQKWQQPGELIGCLPNKRRVYWQLNEDRTSLKVCITDEKNTKSYLRPSQGHIWLWRICACEDEVTGNKAVCHAPRGDESQDTLEIYNSECKSHNLKVVCVIKFSIVSKMWTNGMG